MKAPAFWKEPRSILALLLWPFSQVYALGYMLKSLWSTPKKAPIPVLCVGNVVVGGTGKTPTCLALYDLLIEEGKAIHFLTRGYGGNLTGPIKVDPNKHTYCEVGDEALLLAHKAPTWVSRNRYAGAMAASAAGAQILIMDDGFQNLTLHKDVSLLVIDSTYQFGNGYLLPAGPLREPLAKALKRCQGIITIGAPLDLPTSKPLFNANLTPTPVSLPKKYIAFAGIGRPEKFFKTLENLKIDVVFEVSFPDHHPYTEDELKNLKDVAAEHDAQLLTTEKDFVRLPPALQAEVLTLPVTLTFSDPKRLQALLKGSL